MLNACSIGAGQQQNELVAAVANRDAGVTGRLSQKLGKPAKQAVADRMTVRVVDVLELIEVQDQERQDQVGVLPIDLVFEVAEQEAPVADSGQLVLEDETRRVLAERLQVIDEIGFFVGRIGGARRGVLMCPWARKLCGHHFRSG